MTYSRQVVLICGSRDWTDGDSIREDIESLPKGSMVVHGGARCLAPNTKPSRSADAFADYYARKRGLHVARVDALWEFYGRSAGPLRNHAMGLLLPTSAFAYLLAGPGTGTRDMIRRLREWGVPTKVRDA